MSEPTYRVELTHNPEEGSAVCWKATVYQDAVQDGPIYVTFGESREDAFDRAQTWVRLKSMAPEQPSTVYLTEDGEIHDRFILAP